MRKTALILAAATAAVFAAPAQAQDASGEGRVEARGGIAWAGGNEEAIAGVAAGYDFNLGDSAFIGIEGSADKILASGTEVVWGATGRIGAKVSEGGKVFLAGGYTFGDGEDVPHLGIGYSQKLGTSAYITGEYRRFFSDFQDVNAATLGVGFNF